ncbi:porin [Oceanobacter mangrovi]|uniref:porin n=1 Tax=Oceanobacter mangrovi TaxID=2862510 RepID=UPI001C8DED04|nr:porin [Oceanobacter mangrovi]
MNYKKVVFASAMLTSAISSAYATPSINFYGFVDIGLEKYSEAGINGGSDIFEGQFSPNGNPDGKQFSQSNNVQSRLGIRGEEDVAAGWKGSYRMEFTANVLDNGGQALSTRLGWLALSKGPHTFKVGSQWSPLYGYNGWNTNRSESHGYASYYYITDQLPGSMAYGFRNDTSVSYTYGSGPYSASPFTATVSLQVNDDDRANADGDLYNNSGITGVQVGAASSFGNLTVNAAYAKSIVKESDAAKAANVDVAAPSVVMLGAKLQASDALDFGLAYRASDRDTGKDSGRYSVTASVQYQMTKELGLHFGAATGEDEDETQRQLDANWFGQALYQVTDSRQVRFEFEHVDYGKSVINGTRQDWGSANIYLISMRQSF